MAHVTRCEICEKTKRYGDKGHTMGGDWFCNSCWSDRPTGAGLHKRVKMRNVRPRPHGAAPAYCPICKGPHKHKHGKA